MYGIQELHLDVDLPFQWRLQYWCAIDPRTIPSRIGIFRLFAKLIALHLHADECLATQASSSARAKIPSCTSSSLPQSGHNLRSPLASIDAGTSPRSRRRSWRVHCRPSQRWRNALHFPNAALTSKGHSAVSSTLQLQGSWCPRPVDSIVAASSCLRGSATAFLFVVSFRAKLRLASGKADRSTMPTK